MYKIHSLKRSAYVVCITVKLTEANYKVNYV